MRNLFVALAVLLFASPAFAVDIVDLRAVGVTNFVLSATVRPTSGSVSGFGTHLRLHCTAACSVATSATDFSGTFGVLDAATNYIMIPAGGIGWLRSQGQARYVISAGSGVLTITEMSP